MKKKEKSNPMQFTISFNSSLPKHQQAAAFLNKCGRAKAQIIAEAMDLYLIMQKEKFAISPTVINKIIDANEENIKNDKSEIINTENEKNVENVENVENVKSDLKIQNDSVNIINPEIEELSDEDLDAIFESCVLNNLSDEED